MSTLSSIHPSVYNEFQNGNFVVQRSTRKFSCMALDQSHEQLNKWIKGEGGAVGLTEDPAALRRWMLAGPEVSRVIAEFEEVFCDEDEHNSTKHHEGAPYFQSAFAKDVKSLVATLEELGNPFLECTKELVTLDTKIIMYNRATESVLSAKQTGISQYETFVADKITSSKVPLTDTIARNNLVLFHSHVEKDSKLFSKANALKRDSHLFSIGYTLFARQEKLICSNFLLMRIDLNHLQRHPWEEFSLGKNLTFLIALKE